MSEMPRIGQGPSNAGTHMWNFRYSWTKFTVSWDLKPCSQVVTNVSNQSCASLYDPQDSGCRCWRNVGNYVPDYVASGEQQFSRFQYVLDILINKRAGTIINSVASNTQANYTDRAIAVCRRSWYQIWRIEGVAWSAHWIPTAVNLSSLNRSRYFLEITPQLSSRGWVDPVRDPLVLRISGSAGNGTRTSGSVARNSDH
jgi:hypothetical protein